VTEIQKQLIDKINAAQKIIENSTYGSFSGDLWYVWYEKFLIQEKKNNREEKIRKILNIEKNGN